MTYESWQTKGGLFGSVVDYAGLDPNTIAELAGARWTSNFTDYQLAGSQPATRIGYWFSDSIADYNYPTDDTSGRAQLAAFQQVTEVQREAILQGLNLVQSYTKLTFAPAASSDEGALHFAKISDPPEGQTAPPSTGGYPPQAGTSASHSGDVWFAKNGDATRPYFGGDEFSTIIHEIGHALGLKHGHETDPNGALATEFDNHQFSVMTYRTYTGATYDPILSEANGSSPQGYMMFDIAALQSMYGANFSRAGQQDTYKWNGLGQELINNVSAPNTGPMASNKIFSTVWNQGAATTYDLSDFSQNQVDDLRPGYWLTFSASQLADLNKDDLSPQFKALGNIYNALLYKDDPRSLIDNLITGSGDDRITGNDGGNKLVAGDGNDEIHAAGGDDTISGGLGRDVIDPGLGYDTVRDTLAGLNGDFVQHYSASVAIDYLGIRFDLSQLQITTVRGQTTFKIGDSSLTLEGSPINGEYAAYARGAGADMHTTVSYVPYLPNLSEGTRVADGSMNGIVDRAFLTGDGTIRFSATIDSAVSAFSNVVGIYKIGTDGRIFDAHVLFGNSHNVGSTTVDLGTPGNGVQFGFFVIQDGYTKFGNVTDDLSFVMSDTMTAATTKGGAFTLVSASHGALNGATVFHSLAQLNPNGTVQVLSGTAPGGHTLALGFEDLASSNGDNDFQDVVMHIHSSGDLFS